ncbi:MAG: ribosome hibernation-promoting factor, HPF/YfiA family [Elusimicrobiota bacterium]
MDIHLTAKQIKVTPAIRAYVQEKVEKAQRHFDHIISAQVFLSVQKRSHNAEIVVRAPGHTFRALATAADLYSAVDLAADKVDAQLKKFKEKIKSKHKAGLSARFAPRAAAPAPSVDFPLLDQAVSPMTPEEAAREMEVLGQNFRLFQDRESRQVRVVFRREDESLAVLRPVLKNGG